ncbi:uncharacterized protein PG998_012308 [Apiospora kogelbergensis]|uniref:uncharacterized protein n=1 Tax=Apiospora kogelbergensis TaxID=1337665 RepID=UPI00312FAD25
MEDKKAHVITKSASGGISTSIYMRTNSGVMMWSPNGISRYHGRASLDQDTVAAIAKLSDFVGVMVHEGLLGPELALYSCRSLTGGVDSAGDDTGRWNMGSGVPPPKGQLEHWERLCEARQVLAQFEPIGRAEEISAETAYANGIRQGVMVEFKNYDPDRDVQTPPGGMNNQWMGQQQLNYGFQQGGGRFNPMAMNQFMAMN